ncbi:MAG: hypothetical protein GY861_01175 [bacterium]|nr:hypothetical protein [bacterium]
MTKDELLQKLKECAFGGDTERDHAKADDLLIEYINDKDIENAYKAVEKWYA